MIAIDYACNTCGIGKSNQEMESFSCECGGTMKLGSAFSDQGTFTPYYSDEMKVKITSSRQESKLLRKHGLVSYGDLKELRKKAKFVRENREDIIRDRYAKEGIEYKRGQNLRFDENRKVMVHANSNHSAPGFKRKYF